MSLSVIDNPSQKADVREASLKSKLEAVRTQLRHVQRDLQAVEGRFLDFATAETLQRSLHHSIRQLEAVTISVAVLERKEGAR